MVVSNVVSTLELAVEFKSPADKFWEALKTWSSILPEVLPETYTSIEVVEDVDGEKNGSVTLWKMNPSTLIKEAPVMMEEKKKLGSVDEVTKTITYSVIGGDLLKLYKSYEPNFTLIPKISTITSAKNEGDDDKVEEKDETIGGGTVKWSVKYEKVNEMVPEPNMVKAMIYKTILILDEHVLSKQNEVVKQDEHILSKQNEVVEQKEQTEVITN
ncbi:hypothetical protein C5167_050598 [Papaver somniferum]|uniref:Bet v I/Major latex protein domain-containing protein n=1 Tax=Papaver somniferum TaxID=3469 RepID=A0A4Y7KQH9_PAPSO|nr:MLP-like protein 423 [Papaver somniferum]RZC75116.1 hypothetical protein C5167_050598 [Papaver somniferum]